MRNPDSETYRFDEFLVNARKRTLTNRDGQTIPLNAKAFDTLLHLLRNSGTVLNKEALMKAIWPDTIVEENNLNQSISPLRRALGDGRCERRYIVTIPGRGYRFVANVVAVRSEDEKTISIDSIALLPSKPLVEANWYRRIT